MLFAALKSIKRFLIYRYKHIVSDNVVPFPIFYSLLHNSKTVRPALIKVTENHNIINVNQMPFAPLKSIKPFLIYRHEHIESLNVVLLYMSYILVDNSETVKPTLTKMAGNLNTINANQMLFTPLKSINRFRYMHINTLYQSTSYLSICFTVC